MAVCTQECKKIRREGAASDSWSLYVLQAGEMVVVVSGWVNEGRGEPRQQVQVSLASR